MIEFADSLFWWFIEFGGIIFIVLILLKFILKLPIKFLRKK